MNNKSEENFKDVLDEQRHVTENVTELCRYISFGILATCYALFTSDAVFAKKILENNQNWILASALSASLAIASDYLQFLAGYVSVRKALKNKKGNFNYDPDSRSQKFRYGLFIMKQILVTTSVLFFVYFLYSTLNSQ
ncbi:MAG: hypothetical protein PSY14_05240 [bacterium]|nr:hypothetical protein [bacterium]